jgi:hypothetical protein
MGDALTEFFGGSTLADLVNGARVEVKGDQRDGFIYAERIHVNRDDNGEDTEFTGVIEPLSPLTVGSTIVQTTAATEVRRRGDSLPLSILQAGMTVEVSGRTQSDGSVIARKITIEGNGFDVDVEGPLTLLVPSPACPAIQFTIGTLTFVTSSRTEFKKTTCAALTDGTNVKVRGVLHDDGVTVEVTRLEIRK